MVSDDEHTPTAAGAGGNNHNTSTKLVQLRVQRTLFERHIQNLHAKVTKSGDTEDAETLNCRLQILESHHRQLSQIQTQIENAYSLDKERGSLEEMYIAAKVKILSLIQSKRSVHTHSGAESSFFNSSAIYGSGHNNRLPKLKLPSFDGKYANYKRFSTSFHNLIHNDPQISTIDKFNYLLDCLSGPALEVVQSFQITEENYEKALERLSSRYDNNVRIFHDCISNLFAFPQMKRPEASTLQRLIDNATAIRGSLLSLGSAEEIMNSIMIYIVLSKVDTESKSNYDERQSLEKLSTWEDFCKILNRRCQFLEGQRDDQSEQRPSNVRSKNASSAKSFVNIAEECLHCKSNAHYTGSCKAFNELPLQQRLTTIKNSNACFNCLRKAHRVKDCQSKSRCKVCQSTHHTLLHKYVQASATSGPQSSSTFNQPSVSTSLLAHSSSIAVLPSALVQIQDNQGQFHVVRALLDSCSEVSFITEETAKRLQLKRSRVNQEVSGISESKQKVSFTTFATLKSRSSDFTWSSTFSVVNRISVKQPQQTFQVSEWNLPSGIELADPHFHESNKIQLLISVDGFFDAIREGKIKLGEGMPYIVNTAYGWIVGGNMETNTNVQRQRCYFTVKENPLDLLVERFWEVEDCKMAKSELTEEERLCEEHFRNTVTQEPTGRIQVRLPFKESPSALGESYSNALRRFKSLERKLDRDDQLRNSYVKFMDEYIALGHMSVVHSVNLTNPHYYIPHHCVLRPESLTTKLRVVFDASAKTQSGKSLNDLLRVGPTIQQDLITTFLSFRLHRYALTGDIAKMYRQFTVEDEDKRYQWILWRSNPSHEIETYQLNTITYGTSAAPYLAIRSVHHIADLYAAEFPVGAATLRSDLYVDDVLTGADDIPLLQQKKDETVKILAKAGLQLTKFSSNSKDITPTSENEVFITLDDQDVTKTLGVAWQPHRDIFVFRYECQENEPITKRSILSRIARTFDLLGFISPVVIRCKILLQDLTLKGIDWDVPVEGVLRERWTEILDDLKDLHKLAIPRFVFTSLARRCEIHGFSDASERAYGCCIYVRAQLSHGIEVNLLVAKSKVAPMKVQSLPRLELCGALLLSRVWRKFAEKLAIYVERVYFWSDSKIVLQWLQMHSSKLQCFVANRVSELQEYSNVIWRHVPSAKNPADIISRGCRASDLLTNMWMKGPDFLKLPSDEWPQLKEPLPPPTEVRAKASLVCSNTDSSPQSDINSIIEKYSSYLRILHVVSYMFRSTNRVKPDQSLTASRTLPISAAEMTKSFWRIIALIQGETYAKEIAKLKKNQPLQPSLQGLSPFVQEMNIDNAIVCVMRVGGRLTNAEMQFEAKHQALLPQQHRFTKLYVEHLHRSNLHAGPRILLALLRERIWVINARALIRKVVRNCISCFHYKPRLMKQIMGNLPSDRLRGERPFLITGVDFCGPFLTTYRLRGKAPYKTYAAIFVCFASKAIHIELVSELSTNSFLLCLRRFIARRGVPERLCCDNGTNFVGAATKLAEFEKQFLSESAIDIINLYSTSKGFEFCFIPPRAPHFGGLWEAAVKAAKTLVVKNLTNAHLTYEELQTLFLDVEAILNSRPIAPASDDPNDIAAVTPAHLLIGTSLTSAPEAALHRNSDPPGKELRYVDRWQRVTYLKQQFWALWQRDYVHTLQQRIKWTGEERNLSVGQLVIIHEDNTPPQQWLLARVVATIPGKDGRVRVADVRTAKGILRRPIHKLAPLPID